MTDRLYAWSDGQLVGVFETDDEEKVSFSYSDTWNRPISLSLPFEGEWSEDAPLNFLNGLLPDSANERLRMADALNSKSQFCFDLLDSVDAIGGLVFTSCDSFPIAESSNFGTSRITKKDFVGKIDQAQISSDSWWVHDDRCRFSLAGTQSKFSIARIEDAFYWPNAFFPSTHIIKPELKRVPQSAEIESLTLDLAASCGIDVPNHGFIDVDGRSAFVIERFDRVKDQDGFIHRVHTEDITQSLGLPRDAKYDVEATDIVRVLKTALPDDEIIEKWVAQFAFNTMACNSDAHAKNYSIIFGEDGIRISPIYDSLVTWHWKQFDQCFAIGVNDQWFPYEVSVDDWKQFAQDADLDIDKVIDVVRNVANGIYENAPSVLRSVPDLAPTILDANKNFFTELGICRDTVSISDVCKKKAASTVSPGLDSSKHIKKS